MEDFELRHLIEFLEQRRALLNATIHDLEQLCNLSEEIAPKRPGRKSVDAEERRRISERMKARWAARRLAKTAGASGSA